MSSLGSPFVHPLAFDTRIFGLPCGRIELGAAPVDVRQLDDLLVQARDLGLRHLVVRVPTEWPDVCAVMEYRGLRWAVNSVSLEKDLTLPGPNDARLQHSRTAHESRGHVMPYTGDDDDQLVAITAEAFRANTRFHCEPAFAPERVTQLHEEWIRNLIADASVHVFVCRNGEGETGNVTGYVTLSLSEGSDRGHIGLIAVDSHYHRQGIGQALLRAAEQAMSPQLQVITVMTESTNTAALHLYARTGYTVRRSWSVMQGCFSEENRHATV